MYTSGLQNSQICRDNEAMLRNACLLPWFDVLDEKLWKSEECKAYLGNPPTLCIPAHSVYCGSLPDTVRSPKVEELVLWIKVKIVSVFHMPRNFSSASSVLGSLKENAYMSTQSRSHPRFQHQWSRKWILPEGLKRPLELLHDSRGTLEVYSRRKGKHCCLERSGYPVFQLLSWI